MPMFLDFYDDASGSVLKRNFKTAESIPEFIKQAHVLTPKQLEVLRDDGFALVMSDSGKIKRAFPIIDAGNTALSSLYFISNMDRLPAEAQQEAAKNLVAASESFGLPVAPIIKTAAKKGVSNIDVKSRARDPMDAKEYTGGLDSDWNSRTNMQSVQGRQTDPSNIRKTASVVDVTGKKPLQKVKKASATRCALNGMYPLDSISDVQKANDYFMESYKEFLPSDRREFCVKLASRAEELAIPVDPLVLRYGGDTISEDLEALLATRVNLVKEAAHKTLYKSILENIESAESLVEKIASADDESGLKWHYDGHIPDPYFTVYGNTTKQKLAFWSWQAPTGELVNAEQLNKLAHGGKKLLGQFFDTDTINGFVKSPVEVFDSLPLTSKTIILRLANDLSDNPVM